MANSNNWGEIYNSTWWGDEDWTANSLKIDSAPPGFAGQNLLLGSEELNKAQDGQWIQRLISSVTADDEVAPIGGETTAESVAFTANKQSRIEQLVTLVAGTEYTFSVWAKATGGSPQSFRLSYYDNTAGSGARENETAPTSWDASTGRATMTFTAASSGTYWMRIQNASAGAAQSIYFWGAMLNEGAAAGDYIKTTFAVGPTDPPVANAQFGDNFGRVSAYYSLRQFTTAEDTNAIRVRRSSDDTEQDIGFDSNGDLDTTALTTFVNADVDIYTSDFTSGNEDMAEVNGTGADGQTIGGVSDAYKFTLSGGAVAHYTRTDSSFDRVNSYDVSFDYYIPSGQTIDGIRVRTGATGDGEYDQTTLDAWTSVAIENWTPTSKSTCRFNALVGSSIDPIDADGDVFYLKNIVVTQTTADGAVTTFYDQTGNGNDATNSTESEQPLVVSGGSVLVDGNGKAKIQATASTQYLTASRINPNPLYSFYALEKGTSTGAFSGFTGQWVDSYAIFFGSTRASVFDTSGTRHNVARGTTMTSGNRYLISAVFDNDIEIYQDGTLEGSVSAVGDLRFSDASQKLRFFSYSANNSDPDSCLQEIIIFNSDQSTNRTGIETNINDHFDIYT